MMQAKRYAHVLFRQFAILLFVSSTTWILSLVRAASYQHLAPKKVKSNTRAATVATGSSAQWTLVRSRAYRAIGNLSYCSADNDYAGLPAWELRFKASLHRTALQMDLAGLYYRCSILADPLYSQAWIEVGDLLIHDANADQQRKTWEKALVRSPSNQP